jgi:hypothetical protein
MSDIGSLLHKTINALYLDLHTVSKCTATSHFNNGEGGLVRFNTSMVPLSNAGFGD